MSGALPTASKPRTAAEPAPRWSGGASFAGGDLLDVNVWLALTASGHQHHAVARRYWATQRSALLSGQPVLFCRVAMLALVRLLTQLKVMGDSALNLTEAANVYRRWRAQPGVDFLPDDESADALMWPALDMPDPPLPPRLWTDLWFASQARAHGLRMVTFDADFRRFGLEQLLVLDAAV